MSYTAPTPADQRPRPGSVTAAGYLLYLVAVLLLIGGLIPLTSIGKVVKVYQDVYANTPQGSSVATGVRVGLIATAIIYLILAVGIAVLATFNLRGSNVTRIITWVVAGLGVLCYSCGLVGTGVSGSLTNFSGGSVNGVDTAELARRVKAAQPSWLQPTTIVIDVIGLLAVILVIILLALPSSSAYFRKQPPAQYADPGFPQMPYPSVPGYPQPGQPPAAQPPASGPPPQQQPPQEQPPPQQQPPQEQPPTQQPPAQP